jgi:hypothetical protein
MAINFLLSEKGADVKTGIGMKNIFLTIVAIIGFGISANAQLSGTKWKHEYSPFLTDKPCVIEFHNDGKVKIADRLGDYSGKPHYADYSFDTKEKTWKLYNFNLIQAPKQDSRIYHTITYSNNELILIDNMTKTKMIFERIK